MAAKTIITVDIDDSKFKDFKSVFDEYKAALEETPDVWKDAGSEMGAMTKASELLRNDAEKRLALFQLQTAEEEKAEKKKTKAALEDKKRHDEAMKRWKAVGGAIKSASAALIKFTALGVGVAGGAGLLGFNKLTNDASYARFQSMGLGVSSGAMQSANINYQSMFSNPAANLSAVRDAQQDLSKQKVFYAAGISNYQNKSTEQLLPDLIRAVKDMTDKTPKGQLAQTAQAYGYTDVFSMEDITRISQMSKAEIAANEAKMQQDAKALAVNDSTLKSYQDLQKQWDRFSQSMENTWIKGLEPLAPSLTKFSEAIDSAFAKLMNSGKLGPLIDKLAAGITKFSNYLMSPEAEKDFDTLVKGIKEAAASVGAFAAFVKSILPDSATAGTAAAVGGGALAAGAVGSVVGGAALPVAAAAAGSAYFGYNAYQSDTAENQEWTQNIVGGIAALFGDKDAIAAQKQIATYTKSSDKALERIKPMTTDEYKKAEADNQAGFVNALGDKFKTVMTEVWTVTKESAKETVTDFQEAIQTNKSYTPMGEAKMGGSQKSMMTNVYDGYRKAGFSDAQAKVMTAEVGRENDFSEKLIFGTHVDPHNKAVNLGMISMQGSRGTNLAKYMTAKGLMKGGKMEHSQAAIDAMASFQMQEMQGGGYKMDEFLANKNVDYQTGSRLAGKNYVKWRYDDPKYASHKTREAAYYAAINKISHSDYKGTPQVTRKDKNGNLVTDPFAKPTADQQKSVMFKDQGGLYNSNSSRVQINVNNATGGNTNLTALSL